LQQTTLENGITIITEHNPHLKSATLGYFVKAGSFQEKDFPSGTAHFLEHMLFKGTPTQSSRDINEAIAFIGGDINAYTSFEVTNYHCEVPSHFWKEGLNLLQDIFWNASFPDDEFQKERNVILEEIKMYDDYPDQAAFAEFYKLFFSEHPERHSIAGTAESVASITRDHLLLFFNTYYQPRNLVFVATGNIDHTNLVEAFNSFDFKRKLHTDLPTQTFIFKESNQKTIQKQTEAEQAHLVFGFPAPPLASEDNYAAEIMACILAGNMSARLPRIIREEQGLAYAVSAQYSPNQDVSYFIGYAGLDPENLDHVKMIILDEFLRLQNELVSHHELMRAINYTIGTLLREAEKTSILNDHIGDSFLFSNNESTEEYIAGLRGVTAEKIQEIARKHLSKEQFYVSEITPFH
jgi:predicted Zn-dependent peptidase